MKSRIIVLALASALMFAPSLFAMEAGPRGGRLLNAPPHKAEFFVTAGRSVEITFLDQDGKPVDHGGHLVTMTAELPSGRQPIELIGDAQKFVSTQPLPPGDPYRVVVQFRSGPQAKVVNHRIDVNLAHCNECDRAEYACTCDH